MNSENPPLSVVADLEIRAGKDGPVLVDGVDLSVGRGEAIGLVGESGCGKTLTMLAMAGLLPNTLKATGRVTFNGVPVTPDPPLGSGIGFVFQDPAASLTPVLTVGRQIAEVLRYVAGGSGKSASNRSRELLEEVGVDPSAADRYPHRLSGGEKQRVGIAIALAADPLMLIADEPTTGVDVIVQAQVLELLSRLREQRGMSLVMVSHDLAVVSEICDRVAVLYAGQVVEEGPVRRVLQEPAHPYTQGLLDCLPSFGGTDPVRAIPGGVPHPGHWPQGCRFAPRCDRRFDLCDSPPNRVRLSGGGVARCWLHPGEPG